MYFIIERLRRCHRVCTFSERCCFYIYVYFAIHLSLLLFGINGFHAINWWCHHKFPTPKVPTPHLLSEGSFRGPRDSRKPRRQKRRTFTFSLSNNMRLREHKCNRIMNTCYTGAGNLRSRYCTYYAVLVFFFFFFTLSCAIVPLNSITNTDAS